MPTTIKSENLSCRISPEHKKMIERAARRSGFSVSDFVTHTLVAAASDLLQEEASLRLSKADWERFTNALERPAREPSAATKRAVVRYRKGQDKGDRREWRAKP